MALFIRMNTFSLLNHCYCKFSTGSLKLKTNHISISSNFTSERLAERSIEKKTKKSNVKATKFETEIFSRRNQACRSILVQVYSSNSYGDLQSYCIQFGQILSMHHYRVDKQHNYILVEFEDKVVVNGILSCASFMESDLIVPVRSSVLWFCKGKITDLCSNKKKLPLATENGYTYPSEQQIAHILHNARSISGQIINLYDILKLNELEIRLRFHTAYHLEQYFSGLFHNMRVLPFGSSINGFGRKRCDLDLVFTPCNIEKQNLTSRLIFHTKSAKISKKQETKEFMEILASTMQHFIPGIRNVRKILEARVPIIKFNYQYTNLECDLSTTNMTAIYMSELLNLYGEIDWRVRPLVTTIREWAKSQKITSDVPGQWITNFSLSLLVIFYLQQKNILPSLKTLKSYASHDDLRQAENGIDCTFLRDIEKLPIEYKYKSNQDTLEMLLHGFFEYYSTFDFFTNGICIREGTLIRKPSSSALYIVNPFETTLNVSKNVSIYELNRITEKTHDAMFVLETNNNSGHDNWGLMALLKINNVANMNSIETQNINDHLNNNFHQVSDKIEDDIDRPTKKEDVI